MRRTEATWKALERDGWLCQWHLLRLGVVKDATDGHHLYGRQVDVAEAIIALCHDCHMKVHSGEIKGGEVREMQITRGVMSKDAAARFDRLKTGGVGRGSKDR